MKRFFSVLTLCMALSTSVGVNNSQAGLAFILGAGLTEGFDELGWSAIGSIGTASAVVGGLGLIVVAASNGGSGGSSNCESSRTVPVYSGRTGHIIGHRTVCDRYSHTPGTPAGPMSRGAKIAMWIAGGLLLLDTASENQLAEQLGVQFPFIEERETLTDMARTIAASAGNAVAQGSSSAFVVSFSESEVRAMLSNTLLTDSEMAHVIAELR